MAQVFTYGAPMFVRKPSVPERVFQRVLANAMAADDRLHCFVNTSDPVPRIARRFGYMHETACGRLSSFYMPTADGGTEKLSDERRAEESARKAWRFSHHSMDKYERWMLANAAHTVFMH